MLTVARHIFDAVCVPLSEIHTFQPSIFLAMEYLSNFTRGYEDVYLNNNFRLADVDAHIVIVETNIKKENDGLSMILLKPPGLVGEAAFNHRVQFSQREYSNK